MINLSVYERRCAAGNAGARRASRSCPNPSRNSSRSKPPSRSNVAPVSAPPAPTPIIRNQALKFHPNREALLADADVLAVVNRPPPEDFARLKRSAVVIGFLRPLDEARGGCSPQSIAALRLSQSSLSHASRALSQWTPLSSMATVAGYKAVLIGASHIPRMFPLLMTAAGTVPPARVLVLGAGRRRTPGDRDRATFRRSGRKATTCAPPQASR
jgi:hypothetical protein